MGVDDHIDIGAGIVIALMLSTSVPVRVIERDWVVTHLTVAHASPLGRYRAVYVLVLGNSQSCFVFDRGRDPSVSDMSYIKRLRLGARTQVKGFPDR